MLRILVQILSDIFDHSISSPFIIVTLCSNFLQSYQSIYYGAKWQTGTICSDLQGDTSGCGEPPVDIKTTVPFWPGLSWPGQAKQNFSYDVNGRFATT